MNPDYIAYHPSFSEQPEAATPVAAPPDFDPATPATPITTPTTPRPRRPYRRSPLQPSARRIASSRGNGALSKGPRSRETQLISSRNNLRHGLLADHTVLPCEDREQFDLLLAENQREFQPSSSLERAFVEDVTNSYWRVRRLRSLETRALEEGAHQQSHGDETHRILNGFNALADQGRLDLYIRYEAHLHRIQDRAIRNLLSIQKQKSQPRFSGD